MNNVLMIALDDLFNVQKFRTAFGVEIQTPNLDRLSDMGVTFDNAFASTAVCNPSRTSVLSGQSPFKTGVHFATPEQWNDVMAPQDTLVGALHDAGYHTIGTGKNFHNQSSLAVADLFDEIYDRHFQSRAFVELPEGRVAAPLRDGMKMKDDVNTAWAVNQLANYSGSDPMFMTVGIIRPHAPFIAPQEFFDLYPQSQLVLPANGDQDLEDVSDFYKEFRLLDNYNDRLERTGLDKEFVQGYLASISYADAKLGALLDAAESNPMLDDLSIVLWSDHGYELGWKNTWNKWTLWEEGANAPLIVVDPSLPKGVHVDAPVSLLDIFPTVLDIADAPAPAGRDIDGRSLLPLGNNPNHPGWSDASAVTTMVGSLSLRTHDHRLIVYNDGGVELYDINADPDQITNIAQRPGNQALVASLTDQLVDKVAEQGAVFDPDRASLIGGDGQDIMIVTDGQTGRGGRGDDFYFVGDGANVVEWANGGHDQVIFADLNFTVPDNVEYVRNHGFSNAGTYRVVGNDQANEIEIEISRAEIYGRGGDDHIVTARTSDFVNGGDGDDVIVTESGRDNQLYGGAGADHITGGSQGDHLYGGAGRDTLLGGAGDDVIRPGAGADAVSGGAGVDILEYEDSTAGVILDLRFGRASAGHAANDVYTEIENVGGSAHVDRLIGDAGANLLLGRGGDDALLGASGDDRLDGGAGADALIGGQGRDAADYRSAAQRVIADLGSGLGSAGDAAGDYYVDIEEILGSAGPDRLYGGAGDDGLFGEAGADLAYGRLGDDVLSGGAGHDTMNGGDGADRLDGGSGFDRLSGGAGDDRVAGGVGDDTVFGDDGDDVLTGGEGDDRLTGGAGFDRAFGDGGDDTLELGEARDVANGGAGDDAINVGNGDDHAFGGAGDDVIEGFAGHDVLAGEDGADRVLAGSGDDIAYGGAGDDVLSGQLGDDQLWGGAGRDFLNGRDGVDRLYGEDGVDRLDGGAGDDILNGGVGNDRFIYSAGSGRDRIEDFENNRDSIALDDALWARFRSVDDVNDVIDRFAHNVEGAVVFIFGGGDTLRVNGVTKGALYDDVLSF